MLEREREREFTALKHGANLEIILCKGGIFQFDFCV